MGSLLKRCPVKVENTWALTAFSTPGERRLHVLRGREGVTSCEGQMLRVSFFDPDAEIIY